MHQVARDRLCRFALPLINKYLGNRIKYSGHEYEVTGLVAHKDGTRTVIIENSLGSEEFITYQEMLSIMYPESAKSYNRIPKLT